MPTPLSFRIDPVTKARLEDIAKSEDRSLSYIAQKAFAAYLDARDFRREQILTAFNEAQTEKEFISGEGMKAWVDSWDTVQELPAPKADVFRR
jgi:predicted transcriptional regulator